MMHWLPHFGKILNKANEPCLILTTSAMYSVVASTVSGISTVTIWSELRSSGHQLET